MDKNGIIVLSSIATGLIFTGIVFIFVKMSNKKRNLSFQKIANENNYKNIEKQDKRDDILHNMADFSFSYRSSKTVKRALKGTINGISFYLFDLQYNSGTGGRQITSEMTIFLTDLEKSIPQFIMKPEGMFSKLSEAFAELKDINFESHPKFSSMFLLKGKGESQIRDLFKPDVLTYFESKKGIYVESKHKTIVFYKDGKTISPDELTDFINSGIEITELFKVKDGKK